MDMLESGLPPRSSQVPRRFVARLNRFRGTGTVRAVAAAAALALLAAEVLPWATLTLRDASPTEGFTITFDVALARSLSLHAAELPAGVAVAFQLGWALLLAAFAVALFGPVRLRRPLSAAAAGLAVGQVALVAGVIGGSSDTQGVFSLFGAGPISGGASEFDGHQGPGMFCAGLAALLALVAAGLVLRERAAAEPMEDRVPAAGYRAAPVVDPAEAWRRGPGAADSEPAHFGPEPVGVPGNGRMGAAGQHGGRRDPWDEDDLGPVDLTVTAVPPNAHLRPGQ